MFLMRIAVALTLLTSSGALGQSMFKNEESLRIYVPGSYTGIMPFLAEGIFQATQVLALRVNEGGGLLGRKIEVVKQDDKADVETALKNAEVALADPNHLLTVGHSFSSIAYPVGKVYLKAGKLFATPYATSAKVSALGGTIFQLCFNDDQQGKILAGVAKDRLKAKNVLVLKNIGDTYSSGLADSFVAALGEAKVPTRTYEYIFESLDYKVLSETIKAAAADVVFLPELKVRAAEMLRSLDKLGIRNIQYLGGDGWGSEEGTLDIFFSGIQAANIDYYYTYHWHPEVKTKANERVVKIFADAKQKPYGPGVIALEFLEHLVAAAEREKTVENRALAKLLRLSSFESATGFVQFTETRTQRNMVLIRLDKEKGLQFDSIAKEQ